MAETFAFVVKISAVLVKIVAFLVKTFAFLVWIFALSIGEISFLWEVIGPRFLFSIQIRGLGGWVRRGPPPETRRQASLGTFLYCF